MKSRGGCFLDCYRSDGYKSCRGLRISSLPFFVNFVVIREESSRSPLCSASLSSLSFKTMTINNLIRPSAVRASRLGLYEQRAEQKAAAWYELLLNDA